MKQEPISGEVNFHHIGMIVLNKKTARALHDRNNTSTHLKLFTMDNLRLSKAERGKDHASTGGRLREVKDIGNTSEAIQASYNYEKIMRFYHPYDPAP